VRKRYLPFILILYIGCTSQNDSPCILQATYDSGPTSSFNFRSDGTFEWTNGSGLGVSSKEGTYKIKDSLITLENSDFDKVIKTKYLLITSKLPGSSKVSDTYMVQVNDKGELVDSLFIFTVYIDRRQKLSN
jgi:hypothetical protein